MFHFTETRLQLCTVHMTVHCGMITPQAYKLPRHFPESLSHYNTNYGITNNTFNSTVNRHTSFYYTLVQPSFYYTLV